MGVAAPLHGLPAELSGGPHRGEDRRVSLRDGDCCWLVERPPARGAADQRDAWRRHDLLRRVSGALFVLPELLAQPAGTRAARRAGTAGGYDALAAEEG